MFKHETKNLTVYKCLYITNARFYMWLCDKELGTVLKYVNYKKKQKILQAHVHEQDSSF
jgi:hypothetical protein